MRVHLGGHLSWYDPQKRSWLELMQPRPIAVLVLARQLGVPEAEIAVVTVQRRAVDLATAVATDDDTVEFYPPIGGG
jgi:molybdopterin converting factor small subunit